MENDPVTTYEEDAVTYAHMVGELIAILPGADLVAPSLKAVTALKAEDQWLAWWLEGFCRMNGYEDTTYGIACSGLVSVWAIASMDRTTTPDIHDELTGLIANLRAEMDRVERVVSSITPEDGQAMIDRALEEAELADEAQRLADSGEPISEVDLTAAIRAARQTGDLAGAKAALRARKVARVASALRRQRGES